MMIDFVFGLLTVVLISWMIVGVVLTGLGWLIGRWCCWVGRLVADGWIGVVVGGLLGLIVGVVAGIVASVGGRG